MAYKKYRKKNYNNDDYNDYNNNAEQQNILNEIFQETFQDVESFDISNNNLPLNSKTIDIIITNNLKNSLNFKRFLDKNDFFQSVDLSETGIEGKKEFLLDFLEINQLLKENEININLNENQINQNLNFINSCYQSYFQANEKLGLEYEDNPALSKEIEKRISQKLNSLTNKIINDFNLPQIKKEFEIKENQIKNNENEKFYTQLNNINEKYSIPTIETPLNLSNSADFNLVKNLAQRFNSSLSPENFSLKSEVFLKNLQAQNLNLVDYQNFPIEVKQQTISLFLGNDNNQTLEIDLNEEKVNKYFEYISKSVLCYNEKNNLLTEISNNNILNDFDKKTLKNEVKNSIKNEIIKNNKNIINDIVNDNFETIKQNLENNKELEKRQKLEKEQEEKDRKIEELRQARIKDDEEIIQKIINIKENNSNSNFFNKNSLKVGDLLDGKIKDIDIEKTSVFLTKYKDLLINDKKLVKEDKNINNKLFNNSIGNLTKGITAFQGACLVGGATIFTALAGGFTVATANLTGAVIVGLLAYSAYKITSSVLSPITSKIKEFISENLISSKNNLTLNEKFLNMDLKVLQKEFEKDLKNKDKEINIFNKVFNKNSTENNIFKNIENINDNYKNTENITSKTHKFIEDYIQYKNKINIDKNIKKSQITTNRFLASGGALTLIGGALTMPIATISGIGFVGTGIYKWLKNKNNQEQVINNEKEYLVLKNDLLEKTKNYINTKYIKEPTKNIKINNKNENPLNSLG